VSKKKLASQQDWSGGVNSLHAPNLIADNEVVRMVNLVPGGDGEPLAVRLGHHRAWPTGVSSTATLIKPVQHIATFEGTVSFTTTVPGTITILGTFAVADMSHPLPGGTDQLIDDQWDAASIGPLDVSFDLVGNTTTSFVARALPQANGTWKFTYYLHGMAADDYVLTAHGTSLDDTVNRNYYVPQLNIYVYHFSETYTYAGLTRFKKRSGTVKWVAACGKKIYDITPTITGGATVTLASFATDVFDQEFAVFNDTLYIPRPDAHMKKWDGGSGAATTLGNAPQAKYITVIQDCIFLAGNPDAPSLLYYSGTFAPGITDPDDSWSGSNVANGGSVGVKVDDGSVITAIGELLGGCVVYKERSIYLYSWGDDGPNSTGSKVDMLVPGIGCVSNGSLVQYNGTHIFLGQAAAGDYGIYQLTGSGVSNLSLKIPDQVAEVARATTCPPRAIIFDNKYHLAYDSTGDGIRDKMLVYDLLRACWYTFEDMQVGDFVVDGDTGKLYFGAPDGFIYRAYHGFVDGEDGAPVNFLVESKRLTSGNPFAVKRWRTARIGTDNLDAAVISTSLNGGAWVPHNVTLLNDEALVQSLMLRGEALGILLSGQGKTTQQSTISRLGVSYREGKVKYA